MYITEETKWHLSCHCHDNGYAAGPVLITGAQPKAGTGHKMQSVSVVFSTLHCEGYIADLRYIAGSLLLGVLIEILSAAILKSIRHGGQSGERL